MNSDTEFASNEMVDALTTASTLAKLHNKQTVVFHSISLIDTLEHIESGIDLVISHCRKPGADSSPATNWILDNDYLLRRAIRQIDEDLQGRFYLRLPAILSKNKVVDLRVRITAESILHSSQQQLSSTHITDFISHYQQFNTLLHAELWALPTLLRLACLETLLSALIELYPDLPYPTASRHQAKHSSELDASQTIGQVITSLSVLSKINWPNFVDTVNCLDPVLAMDPALAYSLMDFETREHYRHVIEQLARHTILSEVEVAQQAISLCCEADTGTRAQHIGYWLIDKGRPELETNILYDKPWAEKAKEYFLNHAHSLYVLSIFFFCLLFIVIPDIYLINNNATITQLCLSSVGFLIPASVLSVTLVNWLASVLTEPQVLPSMDFSKNIPDNCQAAVVVPIIVANVHEVDQLIDRLEIRRLANPQSALRFVFLSDLMDAKQANLPEDAEIIEALITGIATLNSRHNADNADIFMLLHRSRSFNELENCWMGWERKRGKIEQFNAFVINGNAHAFTHTAGDLTRLEGSRFAIVLDADTMLPPGTASQLVSTLAHPLNQAFFDAASHRITDGYTILQPRVELLQESGNRSLFAKLYSGDCSIDIYSRAVSDVYQDLFGTGLFVGKGIYDIASFHQVMHERMAENTLLSHDLIEGVHSRVALTSNIVLYESFPNTYPEHALRLKRWIRGDWQLLPWLQPKVKTATGTQIPNPLSRLDKWKLVDNLRRSLIPPAVFVLFLMAWLYLPGSVLVWTLLAAGTFASYLVNQTFMGLTQGLVRGFTGSLLHHIQLQAGRWLLAITFLVTDSLSALDAILRTAWRVHVSHRNLLQWTTAAHTQRRVSELSIQRLSWLTMWPSSIVALLAGIVLYLYKPDSLVAALPVLLLWFAAPQISSWLGATRNFRRERLNDEQQGFLHHMARRTWHYFDTFCSPEDNWLPPDNFQEDPKGEVAHRTSPTNIGLYQTATLAAPDFGFIGSSEFAARNLRAFDTMDRLVTHQGHLLNWYDTRSLEPLEPRYISTVDNGNLAVCLLTLKQGALELSQAAVLDASTWAGLLTTFELLVEAADPLSGSRQPSFRESIEDVNQAIEKLSIGGPHLLSVFDALASVKWPCVEVLIDEMLEESKHVSPHDLTELQIWLSRFTHQIVVIRRDMDRYFPWLARLEKIPSGCAVVAEELSQCLSIDHRLPDISCQTSRALNVLDHALEIADTTLEDTHWLVQIRASITTGADHCQRLQRDLNLVAERADMLAYGMDFTLLYDATSRLFYIGYNLSTGKLDANRYDLLTSEARLASFFAIAKTDVPVEHWYHLGRPMGRYGRSPYALSWNGSMFEYLMPPLFLPGKRDTLLGESESLAVMQQRHYAKKRGVPWGISESAFGVTDADENYQYHAFGTPELGIRRGLTQDLVVAPYATALALGVWPQASVANLKRLQKLGAQGHYGFIDALDFTPDRALTGRATESVTEGEKPCILVKTYMAHHQGMSLVAIANALHSDRMVDRVLREKAMCSVDLLLQERIPWDVPTERGREDESWEPDQRLDLASELPSWQPDPSVNTDQMQLLGNGRLSSWTSAKGCGGLMWRGQALTRWSTPSQGAAQGQWLYVQDNTTSAFWSVAHHPTNQTNDHTQVTFDAHKVRYSRHEHELVTHFDIVVSPLDDVEIRRVTLSNEQSTSRVIELTSYAEVVLGPMIDDDRHPAFSKLFVHSTFLPEHNALLFKRRPRDAQSTPPVLLHTAVFDDPAISLIAHETDRAQFIGRAGTMARPEALTSGSMSNATGWTLDAVMSLKIRVELAPFATKQLAFLTIVGKSRQAVVEIVRKYPVPNLDWAFENARMRAKQELYKLGLAPAELPDVQLLASLLLQPHPLLRRKLVGKHVQSASQAVLWQFGISGDLPVLLMRMADDCSDEMLELLIRSQNLWRRKGFLVDLVILRRGLAGYEEPLRERIMSTLRDTDTLGYLGRNGGVHMLSIDHLEQAAVQAIESLASIIVDDEQGQLASQLQRAFAGKPAAPRFNSLPLAPFNEIAELERPENLVFDNGFGGFDTEQGEYIVHLDAGDKTPSPWCNILANAAFGSIVSESGLGFTWAINSGEYQLTPWSNDPVLDSPAEVVYLRDEMQAHVWSVTPLPLAEQVSCQIHHGLGYTRWRQNSRGLEQELLSFVPVTDTVKLMRLRLVNRSGQPRRITATYYADWLLGAVYSQSKRHVQTHYNEQLQAIMASNAWNAEFTSGIAAVSASLPPHSISGDRAQFLGPDRDVANPQALQRWDLGGQFAVSSAEPCAAYQVHLDLAIDESVDVVFMLAFADDHDKLAALIEHWQCIDHVNQALDEVRAHWSKVCETVQVHSPDIAFDQMVNRWLPYQLLSSRLYARAGFYQAGGAFGFRDQLQDVLALIPGQPKLVRAQILEASRHQFEQGDALHWWHPPSGRGVRTRCSDDYLWLPYVTARYIDATGDSTILDETVPFLHAPVLRDDEHDRYARYDEGEVATVYEHCCRSLEAMQKLGAHGLPLIGEGDWNDGMNRVGDEGRGESIWLAWFQICNVNLFAPIAETRADTQLAEHWRNYAAGLSQAVQEHAWDGNWFVRAFNDEGSAVGSHLNDECQIDSIAQSWAVLSGAADAEQINIAMASANDRLVNVDERLVYLLDPPFEKTSQDPGYIMSYPPGVRENGGQYTHAATWLGIANARLGDGDKAWQIFDMINPMRRTADRASASHYMREPYVLPGDVAGTGSMTGRGGWTWYTGAASWSWQFAVHEILGIRYAPGCVLLNPCLPQAWAHVDVTLRQNDAVIQLTILASSQEEPGRQPSRVS